MPTLHLFDVDDTLAHTEVQLKPLFTKMLFERIKDEGFYGNQDAFDDQSHGFLLSHGHSIIGWAEFLGKPHDWVMSTIENISHHLHQPIIDAVTPCPELIRLLKGLKSKGDIIAIATHGHGVYARPVLSHLGILGEIVPPELLFDLGRTNGRLKRQEATFHWMEAEIEQFTGQKIGDKIFYEDSLANLKVGMELGYITVFIKPSGEVIAKKLPIGREHCHYWYPTVQQALLEAHRFEKWAA